MSDKLVTIASYLEPVEADMLQYRLEEQGIRCVLDNFGAVQMAWILTQAVGGIKLLVFEQDVDQARAIIAEMQEELAEAKRQAAAAAEDQENKLAGHPSGAANEEKFAEQDQTSSAEDQRSEVSENTSPWSPPQSHAPLSAEANHRAEHATSQPLANEDEDSDDLPILNGREEMALKSLRAVIIGYLFMPLQFYATFLILKALLDPRPIMTEVERKLNWAIGLNGFFWFGFCIFWWVLVSR